MNIKVPSWYCRNISFSSRKNKSTANVRLPFLDWRVEELLFFFLCKTFVQLLLNLSPGQATTHHESQICHQNAKHCNWKMLRFEKYPIQDVLEMLSEVIFLISMIWRQFCPSKRIRKGYSIFTPTGIKEFNSCINEFSFLYVSMGTLQWVCNTENRHFDPHSPM